ncbi:MAG: sugar transferase [Parcubacteria group bacterium]|nr:sugar transferase [Parcubacteria group bacterium]
MRKQKLMHKNRTYFGPLLVLVDFLLIFTSALSAWQLKAWFSPDYIAKDLPLATFLPLAVKGSIFWVAIFSAMGLYSLRRTRTATQEVVLTVAGVSVSTLATISVIFFQKELFNSRVIILAMWLAAVILLNIGRAAIRILERRLFAHGIGVASVILIGSNGTAEILARELTLKPELGFRIAKRFVNRKGMIANVRTFLKANVVDELWVADPKLPTPRMQRLLGLAQNYHCYFRYTPDVLGTTLTNVESGPIAGIPIVELKGTPLEGWGVIVKRVFDLVAASILLLVSLPVMAVSAALILIDSGMPILFTRYDDGSPAYRIGQRGKPFLFFKFRTMMPNTHSLRYTVLADANLRGDGPLVKIKDDPRITRMGRFLRRFSIDELPQLVNVIKGEMSLVGPRPHLPEEVSKYAEHERRVLAIKPGITGMAQVSGRSDLGFEEEVRLDTYYIENWSLLLDIQILLKTPFAILTRREAGD